MGKKFRIVFQGAIRDGLDPGAVRQQAGLRLRASPAQIERIFSGARTVLKQGLDAAQGQAYQQALQQLGMIVTIEAITPAALAADPQPPVRTGADSAAEVCKFERTHINLARAEALLNGTAPTQAPPAQALPTEPARLAAPTAAASVPSDAWMHESGFVSLERAQRKLADAAAQFTRAAETPAHAARQSLPEAAPATLIITPPAPATRPAQVFSSLFQCSHCGTEHQIESRLQLNIATLPASARTANRAP